eukprot:TRINITY_DN5983_c0_g3_i1.p1 TRINITY_DN5983_c0_g3~~TRINITY_DN5983_c0_g3_i1.p1  ORF type:complete len:1559 (-),score=437.44 TRINITY_DN5983_c0_g3_i1:75-4751(-)
MAKFSRRGGLLSFAEQEGLGDTLRFSASGAAAVSLSAGHAVGSRQRLSLSEAFDVPAGYGAASSWAGAGFGTVQAAPQHRGEFADARRTKAGGSQRSSLLDFGDVSVDGRVRMLDRWQRSSAADEFDHLSFSSSVGVEETGDSLPPPSRGDKDIVGSRGALKASTSDVADDATGDTSVVDALLQHSLARSDRSSKDVFMSSAIESGPTEQLASAPSDELHRLHALDAHTAVESDIALTANPLISRQQYVGDAGMSANLGSAVVGNTNPEGGVFMNFDDLAAAGHGRKPGASSSAGGRAAAQPSERDAAAQDASSRQRVEAEAGAAVADDDAERASEGLFDEGMGRLLPPVPAMRTRSKLGADSYLSQQAAFARQAIERCVGGGALSSTPGREASGDGSALASGAVAAGAARSGGASADAAAEGSSAAGASASSPGAVASGSAAAGSAAAGSAAADAAGASAAVPSAAAANAAGGGAAAGAAAEAPAEEEEEERRTEAVEPSPAAPSAGSTVTHPASRLPPPLPGPLAPEGAGSSYRSGFGTGRGSLASAAGARRERRKTANRPTRLIDILNVSSDDDDRGFGGSGGRISSLESRISSGQHLPMRPPPPPSVEEAEAAAALSRLAAWRSEEAAHAAAAGSSSESGYGSSRKEAGDRRQAAHHLSDAAVYGQASSARSTGGFEADDYPFSSHAGESKEVLRRAPPHELPVQGPAAATADEIDGATASATAEVAVAATPAPFADGEASAEEPRRTRETADEAWFVSNPLSEETDTLSVQAQVTRNAGASPSGRALRLEDRGTPSELSTAAATEELCAAAEARDSDRRALAASRGDLLGGDRGSAPALSAVDADADDGAGARAGSAAVARDAADQQLGGASGGVAEVPATCLAAAAQAADCVCTASCFFDDGMMDADAEQAHGSAPASESASARLSDPPPAHEHYRRRPSATADGKLDAAAMRAEAPPRAVDERLSLAPTPAACDGAASNHPQQQRGASPQPAPERKASAALRTAAAAAARAALIVEMEDRWRPILAAASAPRPRPALSPPLPQTLPAQLRAPAPTSTSPVDRELEILRAKVHEASERAVALWRAVEAQDAQLESLRALGSAPQNADAAFIAGTPCVSPIWSSPPESPMLKPLVPLGLGAGPRPCDFEAFSDLASARTSKSSQTSRSAAASTFLADAFGCDLSARLEFARGRLQELSAQARAAAASAAAREASCERQPLAVGPDGLPEAPLEAARRVSEQRHRVAELDSELRTVQATEARLRREADELRQQAQWLRKERRAAEHASSRQEQDNRATLVAALARLRALACEHACGGGAAAAAQGVTAAAGSSPKAIDPGAQEPSEAEAEALAALVVKDWTHASAARKQLESERQANDAQILELSASLSRAREALATASAERAAARERLEAREQDCGRRRRAWRGDVAAAAAERSLLREAKAEWLRVHPRLEALTEELRSNRTSASPPLRAEPEPQLRRSLWSAEQAPRLDPAGATAAERSAELDRIVEENDRMHKYVLSLEGENGALVREQEELIAYVRDKVEPLQRMASGTN